MSVNRSDENNIYGLCSVCGRYFRNKEYLTNNDLKEIQKKTNYIRVRVAMCGECYYNKLMEADKNE